MPWTSFYVIFLVVITTRAEVWECEFPSLLKDCYDFYSQMTGVYDTPAYAIQSRCINAYLWKTPLQRYHVNLSTSDINYIQSLQREMESKRRYNRYKQQPTAPIPVRREFRTLSDAERDSFFNAVNALKNDGLYDALANMHTGITLQSAHEGPGFLAWHREYLAVFETALRRVDPSVSLPYWDSTKDSNMADPTQTSFFSPALVGNGDGLVVNGPFADWPVRADGKRLNRNIGVVGSLFVPDRLELFLNDPTVNLTKQIVVGTGEPLTKTLEGQHNHVHNWVGGDMSQLLTAAQDPIFFMYHAHIDYIWEKFRQKQIALGSANPETDYPMVNSPLHQPNRAMDGFENVTNLEGFSNWYTRDLYTYANSPECADQCGGSRFLRCDETINRCVSLTAADVGVLADTNQNPPIDISNFQFFNTFIDPRTQFAPSFKQVRQKSYNYIQTLLNQKPNLPKTIASNENPFRRLGLNKGVTQITKKDLSPEANAFMGTTPVLERGCQNSFSMNGVADVNRWAYIPVKIVHERDILGTSFNSQFIFRDKLIPGVDIYNPMVYTALRPLFHFTGANIAKFPTCKTVNSGVKKVYIRSDGLTYDGYFVEHAVVDERQPISETTAYVAVKDPNMGPGKAMITAYDSSGRVCEPKCLIPDSFPPAYRTCSGIINISNESPKMYSDDYGEAVRSQWNFASSGYPSEQSSSIFLVFYCSPSVQWPWKKF